MAHAPRPGAPHRGTIAGLARRGHLHDLDVDGRRNAMASGAASTNTPPPGRRVTVRHVVRLAVVPSLVGRGRNRAQPPRSDAADCWPHLRGPPRACRPALPLQGCTRSPLPLTACPPVLDGHGLRDLLPLCRCDRGHRTGRAPAASSRPAGCARGCRAGPGCAVPGGSRQGRRAPRRPQGCMAALALESSRRSDGTSVPAARGGPSSPSRPHLGGARRQEAGGRSLSAAATCHIDLPNSPTQARHAAGRSTPPARRLRAHPQLVRQLPRRRVARHRWSTGAPRACRDPTGSSPR